MNEDSVLAWHFTRDDGTTEYLTEREEVGCTYGAVGVIVLCKNGLHGSISPLDALSNAPGFAVRRVRHSGTIVRGDDKLCSSERTLLWEANARTVILLFAADCAEHALLREREAGREPDARSWAAIETIRGYIAGTCSHGQLRAAGAAGAAAEAAEAAWAAEAAEREWQHAELHRRLMTLAPNGYEEAA